MVSSHFSSFIGMLHSSSSPLFPYTTLFRSGRPGTAAGGDHLRAADPAGALDPAAGPRRLTGVGSAPGHRRRYLPSARAAAGAVRAAARPGSTEATAPASTASASTTPPWTGRKSGG